MNNKIIWVFGSSAAGKETFLKYVREAGLPSSLHSIFSDLLKTEIINESIELVPQYSTDPKIQQRDELVRIIKEKSDNNIDTLIFIKGQDWDLTNDNNRPNKLYDLLLNDKHYILFLHAPLEILYERCKRKVWWDKTDDIDVVRDWLIYQIDLLRKLKFFNNLVAISSLNDRYELLNFEEIERSLNTK